MVWNYEFSEDISLKTKGFQLIEVGSPLYFITSENQNLSTHRAHCHSGKCPRRITVSGMPVVAFDTLNFPAARILYSAVAEAVPS